MPESAMNRRHAMFAVACATAFLVSCSQAPPLDGQAVRRLIQESPAFQGPWADGIVVREDQGEAGSARAQRQLLKILETKAQPLGPLGMSGMGATVWFSWRWQGGPLDGAVFASKAKLVCAGRVWKVYNDLLRDELWRAERGESGEE